MIGDTKIKKAIIATVYTMLMATAAYVTASFISSFYSPTVTYQTGIFGKIQVWNGTEWVDTNLTNWTGAWYTRFVTTSPGYKGNVTIFWQLEKYNGSTWENVTNANVTTYVYLTGLFGQEIYASPDGTPTNQTNWNNFIQTSATYRVRADFSTP
ncbi:MAG: hypothetical protein ACUVUF_06955 [Candidatus Bathycorpusculaceae bacterium]